MNIIQLKALIKETISEVTSNKVKPRKSPTLASILFEEVKDEFEEEAEANIVKQIDQAADKGPGQVRNIVNKSPDKKILKKVLQGSYDEEKEDDVVGIGEPGDIGIATLIPTQKEIDMMQSVGWPLSSVGTLEKMIKSKTSTAPGSISVSGGEVIDGHHRWSGIWAISGKDGKVSAQEMGLPGDTAEKLAAAQLAIAAYKPPENPQPSKDDPFETNIMGKNSAAIAQMIKDNRDNQTDPDAPGPVLNPQFLKDVAKSEISAKWAGYKAGDDQDTIINAIAKKIGTNLSTLPKNPKAPARADMPQFDHPSMGIPKKVKADIYAGLKSGAFNVEKPHSPPTKEKQEKIQEHLSIRWQKLAGILKD